LQLLNEDRKFRRVIRIIAGVLVVTFLAQDVVWAYPDLAEAHHARSATLAPSSFFAKKGSPEEVYGRVIEEYIERNNVPRDKLVLGTVLEILERYKGEKWFANNIKYYPEYKGSDIAEIRISFSTKYTFRYFDPRLSDEDRYAGQREKIYYTDPVTFEKRLLDTLPLNEGKLSKQVLKVEALTGPQMAEDQKGVGHLSAKEFTKRGQTPLYLALLGTAALYGILTPGNGPQSVALASLSSVFGFVVITGIILYMVWKVSAYLIRRMNVNAEDLYRLNDIITQSRKTEAMENPDYSYVIGFISGSMDTAVRSGRLALGEEEGIALDHRSRIYIRELMKILNNARIILVDTDDWMTGLGLPVIYSRDRKHTFSSVSKEANAIYLSHTLFDLFVDKWHSGGEDTVSYRRALSAYLLNAAAIWAGYDWKEIAGLMRVITGDSKNAGMWKGSGLEDALHDLQVEYEESVLEPARTRVLGEVLGKDGGIDEPFLIRLLASSVDSIDFREFLLYALTDLGLTERFLRIMVYAINRDDEPALSELAERAYGSYEESLQGIIMRAYSGEKKVKDAMLSWAVNLAYYHRSRGRNKRAAIYYGAASKIDEDDPKVMELRRVILREDDDDGSPPSSGNGPQMAATDGILRLLSSFGPSAVKRAASPSSPSSCIDAIVRYCGDGIGIQLFTADDLARSGLMEKKGHNDLSADTVKHELGILCQIGVLEPSNGSGPLRYIVASPIRGLSPPQKMIDILRSISEIPALKKSSVSAEDISEVRGMVSSLIASVKRSALQHAETAQETAQPKELPGFTEQTIALLRKTRGNQAEAARALGMTRQAMGHRIEKIRDAALERGDSGTIGRLDSALASAPANLAKKGIPQKAEEDMFVTVPALRWPGYFIVVSGVLLLICIIFPPAAELLEDLIMGIIRIFRGAEAPAGVQEAGMGLAAVVLGVTLLSSAPAEAVKSAYSYRMTKAEIDSYAKGYGRRLKTVREAEGLTRGELCYLLDGRIKEWQLTRWESEESPPPAFLLEPIAELLGVSVEYIKETRGRADWHAFERRADRRGRLRRVRERFGFKEIEIGRLLGATYDNFYGRLESGDNYISVDIARGLVGVFRNEVSLRYLLLGIDEPDWNKVGVVDGYGGRIAKTMAQLKTSVNASHSDLGIGNERFRDILNGRARPSIAELDKMAAYWNVPPQYLIKGIDEPDWGFRFDGAVNTEKTLNGFTYTGIQAYFNYLRDCGVLGLEDIGLSINGRVLELVARVRTGGMIRRSTFHEIRLNEELNPEGVTYGARMRKAIMAILEEQGVPLAVPIAEKTGSFGVKGVEYRVSGLLNHFGLSCQDAMAFKFLGRGERHKRIEIRRRGETLKPEAEAITTIDLDEDGFPIGVEKPERMAANTSVVVYAFELQCKLGKIDLENGLVKRSALDGENSLTIGGVEYAGIRFYVDYLRRTGMEDVTGVEFIKEPGQKRIDIYPVTRTGSRGIAHSIILDENGVPECYTGAGKEIKVSVLDILERQNNPLRIVIYNPMLFIFAGAGYTLMKIYLKFKGYDDDEVVLYRVCGDKATERFIEGKERSEDGSERPIFRIMLDSEKRPVGLDSEAKEAEVARLLRSQGSIGSEEYEKYLEFKREFLRPGQRPPHIMPSKYDLRGSFAEIERRTAEGLRNNASALKANLSDGGDPGLLAAIRRFAILIPGLTHAKRGRYPVPEEVSAELKRRERAGLSNNPGALQRPAAKGGDVSLYNWARRYGIPLPGSPASPRFSLKYPTKESVLAGIARREELGLPTFRSYLTKRSIAEGGDAALWKAIIRHNVSVPRRPGFDGGSLKSARTILLETAPALPGSVDEDGFWNEMEGLWYRMKAGDKRSRVELLERLTPFAVTIADGMSWLPFSSKVSEHDEEVRNLALLVLLEVIDDWDCGQDGVRLNGFLTAAVRNRVKEEIRNTLYSGRPYNAGSMQDARRTRRNEEGRQIQDSISIEDDISQAGGILAVPHDPSTPEGVENLEALTYYRDRALLGSAPYEIVDPDAKETLASELRQFFAEKGISRILARSDIGIRDFAIYMTGSMGRFGTALRSWSNLNLILVADADPGQLEKAIALLRDIIGGGYVDYYTHSSVPVLVLGKGSDFDSDIAAGNGFIDLVHSRYRLGSPEKGIATIEGIPLSPYYLKAVADSIGEEEPEDDFEGTYEGPYQVDDGDLRAIMRLRIQREMEFFGEVSNLRTVFESDSGIGERLNGMAVSVLMDQGDEYPDFQTHQLEKFFARQRNNAERLLMKTPGMLSSMGVFGLGFGIDSFIRPEMAPQAASLGSTVAVIAGIVAAWWLAGKLFKWFATGGDERLPSLAGASWHGRTAVIDLGNGYVRAVKFKNDDEPLDALEREARTMAELRAEGVDVPEPIGSGAGSYIFNYRRGPAISYIAPEEYFVYPEDIRSGARMRACALNSVARLAEMLRREYIHNSLAPLTHHRKTGRPWLWHHTPLGHLEHLEKDLGRSNIRLTGVADFEHVDKIAPHTDLHFEIGRMLTEWALVLTYHGIKNGIPREELLGILKDGLGNFSERLGLARGALLDDRGSKLLEEYLILAEEDIEEDFLSSQDNNSRPTLDDLVECIDGITSKVVAGNGFDKKHRNRAVRNGTAAPVSAPEYETGDVLRGDSGGQTVAATDEGPARLAREFWRESWYDGRREWRDELYPDSIVSFVRKALERRYGKDRRFTLIDIGTGPALFLPRQVRSWFPASEVHALDLFDDGTIGRYLDRSERGDIRYHQSTAEDTGLEDGSFDVVVSTFTLDFADMERSVVEIRRIMKDGGTALVTLHAIDREEMRGRGRALEALSVSGGQTMAAELFTANERQQLANAFTDEEAVRRYFGRYFKTEVEVLPIGEGRGASAYGVILTKGAGPVSEGSGTPVPADAAPVSEEPFTGTRRALPIEPNLTVAVSLSDIGAEVSEGEVVCRDGLKKAEELIPILAGSGVGSIYFYGGLYEMSEISKKLHYNPAHNYDTRVVTAGRTTVLAPGYPTVYQTVGDTELKDVFGNPFSIYGMDRFNPDLSDGDVRAGFGRVVEKAHQASMKVTADFIPWLSPDAVNETNYRWFEYKELGDDANEAFRNVPEGEKEGWLRQLLVRPENYAHCAVRITEKGRQERVILVKHVISYGYNMDQVRPDPRNEDVQRYYIESLKALVDLGVDTVRVDLAFYLLIAGLPDEDQPLKRIIDAAKEYAGSKGRNISFLMEAYYDDQRQWMERLGADYMYSDRLFNSYWNIARKNWNASDIRDAVWNALYASPRPFIFPSNFDQTSLAATGGGAKGFAMLLLAITHLRKTSVMFDLRDWLLHRGHIVKIPGGSIDPGDKSQHLVVTDDELRARSGFPGLKAAVSNAPLRKVMQDFSDAVKTRGESWIESPATSRPDRLFSLSWRTETGDWAVLVVNLKPSGESMQARVDIPEQAKKESDGACAFEDIEFKPGEEYKIFTIRKQGAPQGAVMPAAATDGTSTASSNAVTITTVPPGTFPETETRGGVTRDKQPDPKKTAERLVRKGQTSAAPMNKEIHLRDFRDFTYEDYDLRPLSVVLRAERKGRSYFIKIDRNMVVADREAAILQEMLADKDLSRHLPDEVYIGHLDDEDVEYLSELTDFGIKTRRGSTFIAMSEAPGVSLQRDLTGMVHRDLSDTEKVQAFVERIIMVTEAIKVFHAAGVYHRDLDMDEIFVDIERGRVTFIDFNIATTKHNGLGRLRGIGLDTVAKKGHASEFNPNWDGRKRDLYEIARIARVYSNLLPYRSPGERELFRMVDWVADRGRLTADDLLKRMYVIRAGIKATGGTVAASPAASSNAVTITTVPPGTFPETETRGGVTRDKQPDPKKTAERLVRKGQASASKTLPKPDTPALDPAILGAREAGELRMIKNSMYELQRRPRKHAEAIERAKEVIYALEEALIRKAILAAKVQVESGVVTPRLHYEVIKRGERWQLTKVIGAEGAIETIDIFTPQLLKRIKAAASKEGIDLTVDVHIMMVGPDEELIKGYIDAGADYVVLHWKAFRNKEMLAKRLAYIIGEGSRFGIACAPDERIGPVLEFLRKRDLTDKMAIFQQMTTLSGRGGQKFLARTLLNVYKAREMLPEDVLIQVDGGMDPFFAAKEAIRAGADIIVSGEGFFGKEQVQDHSALTANYMRFMEGFGKAIDTLVNKGWQVLREEETSKYYAALEALRIIKDMLRGRGDKEAPLVIGLGSGTTVRNWFLQLVREAVIYKEIKEKDLVFISSSTTTADLLNMYNMPTRKIEDVKAVDAMVIGVDAIDRDFYATKGSSGAITDEKEMIRKSKRTIVIADESKLKTYLGSMPLAAEVREECRDKVEAELRSLGAKNLDVMTVDGKIFRPGGREDRIIIDFELGDMHDPEGLARRFEGIEGIVMHPIFFVDSLPDYIIAGNENGAGSIRSMRPNAFYRDRRNLGPVEDYLPPGCRGRINGGKRYQTFEDIRTRSNRREYGRIVREAVDAYIAYLRELAPDERAAMLQFYFFTHIISYAPGLDKQSEFRQEIAIASLKRLLTDKWPHVYLSVLKELLLYLARFKGASLKPFFDRLIQPILATENTPGFAEAMVKTLYEASEEGESGLGVQKVVVDILEMAYDKSPRLKHFVQQALVAAYFKGDFRGVDSALMEKIGRMLPERFMLEQESAGSNITITTVPPGTLPETETRGGVTRDKLPNPRRLAERLVRGAARTVPGQTASGSGMPAAASTAVTEGADIEDMVRERFRGRVAVDVADLDTGDGAFVIHFGDFLRNIFRTVKMTGVESSARFIDKSIREEAIERGDRIVRAAPGRRGEYEKAGLTDGSQDIVTINNIERHHNILPQAERILRPGGLLFITVHESDYYIDHFDRTLIRELEERGFRVAKYRPIPADYPRSSRFSEALLLICWKEDGQGGTIPYTKAEGTVSVGENGLIGPVRREEIESAVDAINGITADSYGTKAGIFGGAVKERIVDKILGMALVKGDRVLVVGTEFTDYLPALLARIGLRVHIIDKNAAAVEFQRKICGECAGGADVVYHNSYHELDGIEFDRVFALGVFSSMENPAADSDGRAGLSDKIMQMVEHLKKDGGYLYVNIPYANGSNGASEVLYGLKDMLDGMPGTKWDTMPDIDIDDFSMHSNFITERRKGAVWRSGVAEESIRGSSRDETIIMTALLAAGFFVSPWFFVASGLYTVYLFGKVRREARRRASLARVIRDKAQRDRENVWILPSDPQYDPRDPAYYARKIRALNVGKELILVGVRLPVRTLSPAMAGLEPVTSPDVLGDLLQKKSGYSPGLDLEVRYRKVKEIEAVTLETILALDIYLRDAYRFFCEMELGPLIDFSHPNDRKTTAGRIVASFGKLPAEHCAEARAVLAKMVEESKFREESDKLLRDVDAIIAQKPDIRQERQDQIAFDEIKGFIESIDPMLHRLLRERLESKDGHQGYPVICRTASYIVAEVLAGRFGKKYGLKIDGAHPQRIEGVGALAYCTGGYTIDHAGLILVLGGKDHAFIDVMHRLADQDYDGKTLIVRFNDHPSRDEALKRHGILDIDESGRGDIGYIAEWCKEAASSIIDELSSPAATDLPYDASGEGAIDARPVSSGLLGAAYVGHDMAVKKVLNPSNVPFTVLYGGAGADISNLLLSTNATKAYFVSNDYRPYPDMAVAGMEPEEALARYKAEKRIKGYGSTHYMKMAGFLKVLLLELASIGIPAGQVADIEEDYMKITAGRKDTKYLSATQDEDSAALIYTLKFRWAYPGEEEKDREIIFIECDMTQPGRYPDILREAIREKFNAYYQRAGQTMADSYTAFLAEAAKGIAAGGFVVTDDRAYLRATEADNKAIRRGILASLGFAELPPSEDMRKWEERILAVNSGTRYGWDVAIETGSESIGKVSASPAVGDNVPMETETVSEDTAGAKAEIPNFLFRSDTTLGDIENYFDALRQALSQEGLDAGTRKKMYKAAQVAVAKLRVGLGLLRDGRMLGHEPCLGCVNNGGCAVVAGLLAGGVRGSAPVDDCGAMKKPAISNDDIGLAIIALDTFLNEVKGENRLETKTAPDSNLQSPISKLQALLASSLQYERDRAGTPTDIVPEGRTVMLSEGLFDMEKKTELVELILKNRGSSIQILSVDELRRGAISGRAAKDNTIIVLTEEEFNDPKVWNGYAKEERGINSSVLLLDDNAKFIGTNYLYLESVLKLSVAIMAGNRGAVGSFYKLIAGRPISDEALASLGIDPVTFALNAILEFDEMRVKDADEFEQYKRAMEVFLAAA